MKRFLALALMALSSNIYAGNGSSGGGNIYGDQLNPWFLANTKTVNYCVEIAPEFSKLSQDQVYTQIEAALDFWKKTFNGHRPMNIGSTHTAPLATQNFIRSECSEKTDIKFQLGSLTEYQTKDLNYKQLVGFAKRISYDKVNLKAKGFIYIAPEEGRFRPESRAFLKRPWSIDNGFIFKMVLLHELGHVFGLQDDFYDGGLMSAGFADQMTDNSKISDFGRYIQKLSVPAPLGCNSSLETPFNVHTSKNSGDRDSEEYKLRKYLGLKENYSIRLVSHRNVLKVIDSKSSYVYGEIALNPNKSAESETYPAVSLYLPKEQKIFKRDSLMELSSKFGVYNVKKSLFLSNETLELSNGNSMKVFVHFDRNCIPSIGGIFNEMTYKNLFTQN